MGIVHPDRYFARISAIDVQKDLLGCGITHALLDMDNTLVSRASGDVPSDVRNWLSHARNAGVSFCIVSNNWHDTPRIHGRELGIPVVAKACKPLPHGLLAARAAIGARSNDTVVIGDQLLTDVMGAHMLGMKAYLVAPLSEVDLRHTNALKPLREALLAGFVPENEHAASSCAPDARD